MSSTVSPQLVAQFEIDDTGEPAFVETGGRKQYKVVFEVRNAPEGAYAATFELDPKRYDYDPWRTLRPDSDGTFRLETTAYGDSEVKVRLRTNAGEVPLVGTLTTALQNFRKQMGTNPAVDDAIEYIASH